MHKISVPFMASTINETNREEYLKLAVSAGAERVFLSIESLLLPLDEGLKENIRFFKSHGFEVGVWTDSTGHGRAFDQINAGGERRLFSPMVDINGKTLEYAFCPLDEEFRRYVSEKIGEISDFEPDLIMLDDDFRMSQHRGWLCCSCEKHLMEIGKILGEEIAVDELRPYILSGKGNRYRDAYLTVQNEGLVKLAKDIRAVLDEKHPEIPVALCVSSTVWNVDGVEVSDVCKILGGKNGAILRLTGAPYWAFSRERKFSLISVFEIARMLSSFVHGEGLEVMAEGDVFPRPRFTCPSSYLELYDGVTRADGGFNGILKYMFDYNSGPDFEMGYLHHHKENAPYLERVSDAFRGGANSGVRVVTKMHTFKNADLLLSTLHELSPIPTAAAMLGFASIPTIHRGKGVCNAVFGENARELDNSLLTEGVILDAVSALILSEKGIDVGVEKSLGFNERNISFVCSSDENFKSYAENTKVRLLDCSLNDRAEPVFYSVSDNEKEIIGYRYENSNGNRFLVFLFEGDSLNAYDRICVSGLLKNYVTQRVLGENIPWVARKPLPAYCEGNPELYMMCKTEGDEMSLCLFNCFFDPVFNKTILLDKEYSSVEGINCEAEVSGNKVTITSNIPPLSSVMLRLKK